jgi:hypothetical protein
MTIRKHSTGTVLTDEGQPVTKTATYRQLTFDDIREIEREGEDQPKE